MNNPLKRDVAPLTDKAWKLIDSEAAELLRTYLSARRLVDVSGPHGWDFAAVNTGRLEIADNAADESVTWGIRGVLPLVEVRVPFTLSQMALDSIDRGMVNPDLGPLEEAAKNVAAFEESAVYHGFKAGKIEGMATAADTKPVKLPEDPADYTHAVASAIEELYAAGVEGPYALVLGTEPYRLLTQNVDPGFPPARVVERLLKGDNICWSPGIKGGMVMSLRGGDFELTLGQDLSIGYATHDRNEVELYFTESFTFRVIEPAAAVPLR